MTAAIEVPTRSCLKMSVSQGEAKSQGEARSQGQAKSQGEAKWLPFESITAGTPGPDDRSAQRQ
jgi:hypothetical protein